MQAAGARAGAEEAEAAESEAVGAEEAKAAGQPRKTQPPLC